MGPPSISTRAPTIDFNGDTVVRLLTGRVIVLAERGAAGSLQIDAAPASVRDPVHRGGASGALRRSGHRRPCRSRSSADSSTSIAAADLSPCAPASRCSPGRRVAQLSGALQLRAARWLRPLVPGTVDGAPRRDLRAVPSRRRARATDRRSTRYGLVELRRALRLRLVSARGRDVAAVLPRPMASRGSPWLDVCRRRSLGLGHVSLRPMGLNAGGAWFWIPSAGWGAAWVNWAVAPGYVGWCPLGWNNRPVVASGATDSDRRTTGGDGRRVPRPVAGVVGRFDPLVPGRLARSSRAVRCGTVPRPARARLRRAADAPVGRHPARLGRRARLLVSPARPWRRATASRARGPPSSPTTGSAHRIRRRRRLRRRSSRHVQHSGVARLARPTVIYHRGTPIDPQTGVIDAPARMNAPASPCLAACPLTVARCPDPPARIPARDTATPTPSASPYGGDDLAVLARSIGCPRSRARWIAALRPPRLRRATRRRPDRAAAGPGAGAPAVSCARPASARAGIAAVSGPDRGRGSQGEAPRATPRSSRHLAARARPRAGRARRLGRVGPRFLGRDRSARGASP